MTVREVLEQLERFAPAGLAYSWDRSGLNIGDPGVDVMGILVTLSVTRPVFDAARAARANLVVSHHPVLWEPLKTLRTDDAYARLCIDFAAAGIACYSAHTNLDVAPGGVNHVLAGRLGLQDVRTLFPTDQAAQVKLVTFVPEDRLPAVRDAVCGAGAGTIGEYTHCTFSTPGTGTFVPRGGANPYSGEKYTLNEEAERRFEVVVPKARLAHVLDALRSAHPYEEVAYDAVVLENRDPAIALGLRGTLPEPVPLADFAARVRERLEVKHVRMTGDGRRPVQRIAVLGGAGGGDAARMPADVDVLVTGDVKYHDALAAVERGLAIIDAGHQGTEKWIVPAVANRLREAFPALRVEEFAEPEVFTVVPD